MIQTDIFIVSCAKHAEYLKFALRSIGKFARGFHRTVLMFPRAELDVLYRVAEAHRCRFPLDVKPFDEWPDKGMLHHMLMEMQAPDWCPGADLILHFDSDYVFTGEATPETILKDGKPVLWYASYDWLVKQNANIAHWRTASQNALGFPCPIEAMRRPMIAHLPHVYRHAKDIIEKHTGRPMADYIRSCENAYPQTFAEYPALGSVAWEFHRGDYHWIDQQQQPANTNPHDTVPVRQAWSHRKPTAEDVLAWQNLGLA